MRRAGLPLQGHMRHALLVEEQLAVEAQQDAQRQALHICAESVSFLRKDAHRALQYPLSHQNLPRSEDGRSAGSA